MRQRCSLNSLLESFNVLRLKFLKILLMRRYPLNTRFQ